MNEQHPPEPSGGPGRPADPGAAGAAGGPGGPGAGGLGGPPPVGSVGEEAAKLLGALSGWARESTTEEPAAPGFAETLGSFAQQAAAAASAAVSEVDAHLATGAAECTYCPLCRTVHAVRQASPEIRAHLAVAASSLLQAASGLLATLPPPGRPERPAQPDPSSAGAGVEHIDLDDLDAPGPDPTHHEDDQP